jgi:hypothetical protein
VHEAHRKSRDYIECNLKESWLLMHSAVVRSDDCRRHFSEAIAFLAKSLHAVEDSYAPLPYYFSRAQLCFVMSIPNSLHILNEQLLGSAVIESLVVRVAACPAMRRGLPMSHRFQES